MFKILTECPLFRGLNEEQIGKLLYSTDKYSIQSYSKGDIIAKRDIPYSGLMIILKGYVEGRRTFASGKSLTIDILEVPQLIAPAFLFGGYNQLPIDVVAMSDVEIMVLHRAYLFELMQEDVLVLSNFVDIISNRAGAWTKKIYLLSMNSLKEKAAAFLLENSTDKRPDVAMLDSVMITDLFGATRSSFETVLDDMTKRGYVEIKEDRITVVDRQKLEEIIRGE